MHPIPVHPKQIFSTKINSILGCFLTQATLDGEKYIMNINHSIKQINTNNIKGSPRNLEKKLIKISFCNNRFPNI